MKSTSSKLIHSVLFDFLSRRSLFKLEKRGALKTHSSVGKVTCGISWDVELANDVPREAIVVRSRIGTRYRGWRRSKTCLVGARANRQSPRGPGKKVRRHADHFHVGRGLPRGLAARIL